MNIVSTWKVQKPSPTLRWVRWWVMYSVLFAGPAACSAADMSVYPLRPSIYCCFVGPPGRAAPIQYPKNVATYAASSGTALDTRRPERHHEQRDGETDFHQPPEEEPDGGPHQRCAFAVPQHREGHQRRRRHADPGTQQRRCASTSAADRADTRPRRSPRAGPDSARRPAPGAGPSARRGCSRPHPVSGQQKSHDMPALPATGGVVIRYPGQHTPRRGPPERRGSIGAFLQCFKSGVSHRESG